MLLFMFNNFDIDVKQYFGRYPYQILLLVAGAHLHCYTEESIMLDRCSNMVSRREFGTPVHKVIS